MAGAMAGSAILGYPEPSERLKLVTLTVNNVCNLSCPHCYLRYMGEDKFVSDAIVARISESSCEHVAIVGKEPLVSRDEAARTVSVLERIAATGKRLSLVTNGLGLDYLPDQAAEILDFIDVSFDGGPRTYQGYRGCSYQRLLERLDRCASRGFHHIRALGVISSATIHALDDILSLLAVPAIEMLVLSPYIPTRNAGTNAVTTEPLDMVLSTLASSRRFLSSDNAVFLVARHELPMCDWPQAQFDKYVESSPLRRRVHFVDVDPLELGIIRVTYDGYVMSPLESLHPLDYQQIGLRLEETPGLLLDEVYTSMVTVVGS